MPAAFPGGGEGAEFARRKGAIGYSRECGLGECNPWAWLGGALEAPSSDFSFVNGSKRTALQLLCCRAVLVIRNSFVQAMHGSILSSSCCMSIFWLRMSMSFWRSRK